MTDRDIAELTPAFSAFLRRFASRFGQDRTAGHFDNYCRGLLSDLPAKSVEPIALACGTAVRTLQVFLTSARWDHLRALRLLQRHIAGVLATLPTDRAGTVGVVDETSDTKKGEMTPGVQRQHLGCVGKIDNGIVTVHTSVSKGRFQALLECDLFLPKSWNDDRPRCVRAGIPDEIRYRPKWRIAFDQLLRLNEAGIEFDWLTFDEGYGSKVPYLGLLSMIGQRFVGEVPVSFSVQFSRVLPPLRADEALTAAEAGEGRRFRIPRKTGRDRWWRATSRKVHVGDQEYLLVVAKDEETGEVKYFASNATDQPLRVILLVAFRRATIEHGFRVAKGEVGMMQYEGRNYTGLMRHLILCLIVLGFVSIHTDRLRGGKSRGDARAGVPGAEPEMRHAVTSPSGHLGECACRLHDPLSPTPQRPATRSHRKRRRKRAR